ncbi:MAG: hypothetical protein JWN40_1213 [Phycisphaerales bacterium]|nr:hypothetical protein [Phycisphaerales bacterium]
MKKPSSPLPASPAAATPPRQRTAAQADAARKNGAKGRGPKTSAGKAVSSTNALRHGIVARRIAPLPGDQLEDREYAHLRAELSREFSPQTITEHNAVDILAFDYVKLGRVAQMQESPAKKQEHDGRTFVGDAEENLQSVRQMAENFAREAPVVLTLPSRILDELLKLKDLLTGVIDPLSCWDDVKGVERRPPEIFERIDLEGLTAEHRRTLWSTLEGRTPLDAEQRHHWGLVMARWRSKAEEDLEEARRDDLEFRQSRLQVTEAPSRVTELERLQRYDAQIRRAIARGISFLESRRRRGRE